MNIQSIIEEAQENANEQDLTLSEYLEDVLSDILYEELLDFQGTPLEAERYKETLSEALSAYIN
jgi:hypothetical protein